VTLMYRRSNRRLLFLAVCAVVLLVANGIRAYTIILGDHFGIADGADHRVFSYTVYGLTMPLLLWFGLRWQENTARNPSRHRDVRSHLNPRRVTLFAIAAVTVLAFARLSFWQWFNR
jgi:exosortase/archaeosortase family protein